MPCVGGRHKPSDPSAAGRTALGATEEGAAGPRMAPAGSSEGKGRVMEAGARGVPGKIRPQSQGEQDFRPQHGDAGQGGRAGDPAGLSAPGEGKKRT